MRTFIVALSSLLIAQSASAFVRTQTCDPETQSCVGISWPSNCVSYVIDARSEVRTGISNTVIEQEVDASFEAWNQVDCSYLRFSSAGVQDGVNAIFEGDGTEDNAVVFIPDGWTDLIGHDPGAIALTSVFFDGTTGFVVNADIEFNAEFFEPVVIAEGVGSDPTRPDADLRNTFTHEIGHLLGLDHTPIQDATMFFAADSGETKKSTLEQDDIDGVCDIYPLAADPEECKPAGFLPSDGFFANLCAVAGSPGQDEQSAGVGAILLLGMVGVFLASRRRA